MPDLVPISLDFETEKILDQETLPRAVCASLAWRDPGGALQTWLASDGDADFERILRDVLRDPRRLVVTLNGAFDLGVAVRSFPRLVPDVFAALAAGRIVDVGHREKLLRLSTTGRIGAPETYDEDGNSSKVSYSLAELVLAYLGADRSASKAEDSVRTKFARLSGTPSSAYPEEFRAYAVQDAVDTLLVYEAQLLVPGSVASQEFQARADFALRLATDVGIEVDPEVVAAVRARVAEELAPERMRRLVRSGILRSPVPHGGGHRAHAEGCERKKRRGAWLCDCPVKMVDAKAGTVDERRLHELVVRTCARTGRRVPTTKKCRETLRVNSYRPADVPRDAKGKPLYVSTAKELLAELSQASRTLAEYANMKGLSKIKDQALPALESALARGGTIHPNFNVLVDSGRTSSFGNKRGVEPGKPGNLYPSQQGQNLPRTIRGIDVRPAHRARAGRVFAGADYGSLELCCVAQQLHEVFPGQPNAHRELLNSGVELHSHLAANLAYLVGSDPLTQRFRRSVRRHFDADRPLDAVAEFMRWREADEDDVRKWAKNQRNIGKVVGLSVPGGVSAKKVAFGLAPTYDVSMTLEDGERFFGGYHRTYPLMRPYFRWLKSAGVDPLNPGKFAYQSVLGFVRRGATFTAAANGLSMQTRGAFGAKEACWRVQRAAFDPSRGSILYGCPLVLFVHDELWVEMPDAGAALNHYRAHELSRLMVEAMRQVALPDVYIAAEPFLARRMSKAAGDEGPKLRDDAGYLVPWDLAA